MPSLTKFTKFGTKCLFGAFCSSLFLITGVSANTVCNEHIDYAVAKYRLAFTSENTGGKCSITYKPTACNNLSQAEVEKETIVYPFLSFREGQTKELAYYKGSGNNGDGTQLARKNQINGKMVPATYTFDLNSLSGKSSKFGENASKSSGLYIRTGLAGMETGKRAAINLTLDNISTYCSDATGDCKLTVFLPQLYMYNQKSLQQRGNPLFMCLQDTNKLTGVDLRISIEPLTGSDSCAHQYQAGNYYTVTGGSKSVVLTLDKTKKSQDFAFILEAVSTNGAKTDSITVIPDTLSMGQGSACPDRIDPTDDDDNNNTTTNEEFSMAHQIIERSSVSRIEAWGTSIGGTRMITDGKELQSIRLVDGSGKDAAWSAKMAWTYARNIPSCLKNASLSDVTTGDEFDGVGTWTISDKTRNLVKALYGRDLNNKDSLTESCPNLGCYAFTAERKALGDEIIDRYNRLVNAGCTVRVSNTGILATNTGYWLYDFKIKNKSGTNYENMKLIVTFKKGTDTVVKEAVFTARPDRIVINDVDTNYANSADSYKKCDSTKDCFDADHYPVAGLKYKIDKTKNQGYAKTNQLPLEHNFIAVDANGKVVDTYNKTLEANIINASNIPIINGVAQPSLNIPNQSADVVFKDGIGYMVNKGTTDTFKYPYAGHTFVQIVDDSLSKQSTVKCIAGNFNNSYFFAAGDNITVPIYSGDITARSFGYQFGCNTVLIPRPRSTSGFDRTIYNDGKFNRFDNVCLDANGTSNGTCSSGRAGDNDFYNPIDAESGDFWYIFGPAYIRVSHTASDKFLNPDMTYYDDLTSTDGNRTNHVYANLDLNITAYNEDGSVAGAYTSGEFQNLSIRPRGTGVHEGRNKVREGLANDFNMTVNLLNQNLATMQFTLVTKSAHLYTPANVFSNFGTDRSANFTIKRDAFEVGTSNVRTGINLNRDKDKPKNPQDINGSYFDLKFSEIITSTSIAKIPTDSAGIISNVDSNGNLTAVKSDANGSATFFYGRLFVPNITKEVKTTPFNFEVDSYYSVYCSLANCQSAYSDIVSSQRPDRGVDGYFVNQGYPSQAADINGTHDYELAAPHNTYLSIINGTRLKGGGINEIQSMKYTRNVNKISKAGDVYRMKETPMYQSQPAVFLLSDHLINSGTTKNSAAAGFVPYTITFTHDKGNGLWHGAGSQGQVLGVDENTTNRYKGRMSR